MRRWFHSLLKVSSYNDDTVPLKEISYNIEIIIRMMQLISTSLNHHELQKEKLSLNTKNVM